MKQKVIIHKQMENMFFVIFLLFCIRCIVIYFHPGMNFISCWATVHIQLSSPILLTVCEGKAVFSLNKVTYKQKCKTGTHFQMVFKTVHVWSVSNNMYVVKWER